MNFQEIPKESKLIFLISKEELSKIKENANQPNIKDDKINVDKCLFSINEQLEHIIIIAYKFEKSNFVPSLTKEYEHWTYETHYLSDNDYNILNQNKPITIKECGKRRNLIMELKLAG